MFGNWTRGVTLATAVVTVGTGASALLGGVAFACDDGCHSGGHQKHYSHTDATGGKGGKGGAANANCAVPIGASIGLLGQGGDVSQCNATGGAAGNGGTGVEY